MSIVEHVENSKRYIPHYWPIGSFIHHNPLKGFESLPFRDGVKKAQSIYGGRVYMPSGYYVRRYQEGKIDEALLDANLAELLGTKQWDERLDLAKRFLVDVSSQWQGLKSHELLKEHTIDASLRSHIKSLSDFSDPRVQLHNLIKSMTLYEIHDALFETSTKELIEKDIIEFIARFLDEQQTTLSMADRDLGMFGAFKLYENIDYIVSAEEYVEEMLGILKVRDVEEYFLTHLLKLHGWAGFIKYRSEDKDYYAQQIHPTTLMDYLAVRLHYEVKYLRDKKINDFDLLEEYLSKHQAFAILKLLQAKGKLLGAFNDAIEQHENYDTILQEYIDQELNLLALQTQLAYEKLEPTISLTEFYDFATFLLEEEGYIWLKSMEDTYIREHLDALLHRPEEEKQDILSASVFCLDVRSEPLRRHLEASKRNKTLGAGGFLGIPIRFIPFDKPHALNQAPAIIHPETIILEIPVEEHDSYNRQKDIQKTIKKVLNDLKNNPYTPYIMVESIGWMFGIKLFGKTFLPKQTKNIFKGFDPQPPKTTYTLDKLQKSEIEEYAKKLHLMTIKEVLTTQTDLTLNDEQIMAVWNFLVYGKKLRVKVPESVLDKLRYGYNISKKDFSDLKTKLEQVGFTTEEQVDFAENVLKMIGLYQDFPKFVIVCGHGSCSDNNPFESALDCGACGGNISLPNARLFCMMVNKPEIQHALQQRGIRINPETKFIPALHNTTDDTVHFYDTEVLNQEELALFATIRDDFAYATKMSREERMAALPNASSSEEIELKTMDWSEPRPEWGLAKNIGVFAGPRESCAHVDWEGRLFLHSYDASIDTEDAALLTRIFNGPLVVGEWINLEHYFSTVDNDIYGAGSKVYHNIVSKVGVYYGNFSDLKIGLPTQSVWLEGEPYHEPLRLLTYMEAPLEKVGKAVENSIAKEFILNEWIRPVVIDKEAKKVYAYEHGEFRVIKEL